MKNSFKISIKTILDFVKRAVPVKPGGIPENAASCNGAGDNELLGLLRQIWCTNQIPAVAAALLNDTGLLKIAAVGTRKWGIDSPVTIDDLWHLGSNTKAMTATLAAILVKEQKLDWNTSVSEVFPQIAHAFDPGFRKVTLLQLLSHQAGLPAHLKYRAINQSIPVHDQRIQLTRMVFRKKPLSTPGTMHLYSNAGYIVAGAMIEQVTGMDWETAMRQKIFTPLNMKSAGFGGLGTFGEIDQPWGHKSARKPAKYNGPTYDNPPVLGPAGRVHCTIRDWALFVGDQLRGARGTAGLLPPESYQILHNVHFKDDYALGWIVTNREWAGGKALTHVGCNTTNLAAVWIAPEKNLAFLVCINQGIDAMSAANKTVLEIIRIA